MTATAEILDQLAAIGASVRVDADRVFLAAGAIPVPAELVAAVREQKAALLALAPAQQEPAGWVDAIIDAAYRAADAELAGDTVAAERHRAYALALYRRRPPRDPVCMPGAVMAMPLEAD